MTERTFHIEHKDVIELGEVVFTGFPDPYFPEADLIDLLSAFAGVHDLNLRLVSITPALMAPATPTRPDA